MATIVAAAGGGNWNTGATWVGGVKPTAADDAQLNGTSGNVTIDAAAACRSLDCTGYTGTLTHAAAIALTIGDATAGLSNICLKLVAGMTYTLGNATSSAIAISTTSATQQTVATGGKTLGSLTVNTGANLLQSGDLTSSGTATINGAGSTTYDTTTNSVKLILSGASGGLAAGTRTFYEVQFTGSGASNLNTTLTCTNFTRTGTAVKTDSITLGGTLTVTGTLTLQGNSAINRILIGSGVVGTQRTITCNGTITASNADFSDIVGAGSASWNLSAITGNSGDAGGNSGITFTSSATQTWSGTLGGNWSANAWSGRVPLPQDDVLVSSAFTTTPTIVWDMPRLGRSISFAGATGSFTLSTGTNAFYGSLTLVSGMTVSGAATVTLAARSGSWTITSAGRTFTSSIAFGVVAGSTPVYTLQDAFTTAGRLTVVSKLITANFNVTFSVNGSAGLVASNSSTLDLGTSTLTFSGNTATNTISLQASTVINATGSTIIISTASTGTRSITPGANNSFGSLVYTVANSPGALQISAASSWQAISIGSGRQLILPRPVTQTIAPGGWNVNGSNYGYLYLPGVSGAYVSSPDAAPLQITGDLTIDADIAPNSWLSGTAYVIASKRGATGGQLCYSFFINSTGTLGLNIFPDGTNAISTSSTVATGLSAGTRKYVRVSFQANDGASHNVVKFYTSPDGVTWTQLGATVTNAGATSIFNGTSPLEIGSSIGGTTSPFVGNIYRVKIYNSYLQASAGTPVFDADFTTKPFGANSFAESSANAATVSINGILAQVGDGRVSVVSALAGSPATISVASGTVTSDYLVLQDSTALGGAGFDAGAHSVFVSNVIGWVSRFGKLLTLLGIG